MKAKKTIPHNMRKFFATIYLVLISAVFVPVFSQVDFEFWFAAPYASMQHNPNSLGPGGRPIYLRLATQDAAATVVVSMPADPTFAPITLNIPAQQSSSIDLTPYLAKIQSSNQGNVIEDKGLYIRSSALITAYYEISSVLNGDFFSLKGQNALGTEFYAPLQNKYNNSDYHSINHNDPYGLYTVADPAYSYIIVTATEDNTEVSITPTGNAVGIPAGTTKTVVLPKKGQTYVVRSTSELQMPRLGGTKITSTRPVAVTIGDDSMFPQDFTVNNDCEDYAGDQIVPTSVIGQKYWVVKGQGYKLGTTGKEYTEYVFVTATQANTQIYRNGTLYTTLQAGQQVAIDLGGPATSNYMFVEADKPIYVFHVSGYQCEMAGALLPPIDQCTGSYKTGFTRTYGSKLYEDFWMNLMVKGNGEANFTIDGVPHPKIQAATWQTILGTDWKVARIEFTQSDLPVGPHFIQNPTNLFHMAMMNSRSFDWGGTSGLGLMGASYGYFSNFNENKPTAIIVNNNDTSITVARGTVVSLLAGGGYAFNWRGYIWNGTSWDLLPAPYFMNNTSVENPQVTINADGIYKYTASITTECYGVQTSDVYIKIVPPANLNNIYDTVCATPPHTDISEFYNLYNLNDTIVGRQGLVTGYYVDRWYKWVNASTEIWDDMETNRLYSNGSSFYSTLSVVSNPNVTGVNASSDVLYIKKNGTTDPNGMQFYGLNDQQTRLGVVYRIDLSASPISLASGAQFSFDISPDGTVFQGWELPANYNVNLIMIDVSGAYANLASAITIGGSAAPSWQTVNFDFTGYESLTQVREFRIVIWKSNTSWANTYPGFYLDNIKRNIPRHKQTISNPTQYRVVDNDTIIAIVRNYFDVTRVDSANVYMQVLPPGKGPKDVTLAPICATNGNQYVGFDLTQYNYEVGGALIADKNWFLNQALTLAVTNPKNVTVTGTQTFWAQIDDECGGVGSLTVQVSPQPNVMNATEQVCENVDIGGDRGILDLSTMKNRVTTNLDATIQWYSDAARTILVPNINQVFPTDGQRYYANIYYNSSCIAQATLTVTVIPLSDVTFADRSVCIDGGNIILNATPAGGVYAGPGVSGNTFNPVTATAGTHEISYTISNLSCNYTKKANYTVHPLVTASVTQIPAGKLQVNGSATLQGTITPGALANYNYSWTNPSLLTNPTSISPTTVALTQPTNFCLLATDKVTGCDDTVCVLVDVYVPVTVDLQFSANPVCAGEPVTVRANRTGGFGPFQYTWAIPGGTDYTMLNDSVVRINNPQTTINISVTARDLGITPNDVVSDADVLTVNPRPTVTIANVTPTVCQNAPLSISPVVSGGTPNYTHLWTQDTQILTTATNVQNATINTTTNTGTFNLRYTVTDANNCSDFKDVTVRINSNPVVDAIANPDTTCIDKTVQLNGTVTQGVTSGGFHEWISNSGSLPGLSSNIVPNPVFTPTAIGVHRFQYIFTDAQGCKDTSDIVRVRIEPKPTVTINPVAPQCESNLGAQLTAVPIVNGVADPTFTYSWTGAVTSTQASPILNISTAGTKVVTLRVTANNGCESDPATINVVVNPNPLAQIVTPQPMTVCAGSTLNLQANNSTPGIQFTWDGTAKSYIAPTVGASVTFTAPTIITPSQSYNVILTATNTLTGCTAQTNSDVLVYRQPVISLGSDLELCVGSSTILNPTITYAVQPISELRWVLDTTELSNTATMNPTFTQKELKDYTVGLRVTDANGCQGYDEIYITGLANPTADAGPDKTADWNIAFGLTGNASGGAPGYTWLWQPQDSLTTANTVQNPTSILKESTWFQLEVTDSKGCKDIDSVLITVIGQPITVTIIQYPTAICVGQNGTLEAIPSGGTGVYTYEWAEASNPTVVIGTNKTLPIVATINKQYVVRVSSDPFAPASAFHTVVVNTLPQLTIQGTNVKELCLNASTVITPQVQGTAPFSYAWTDGSPFVITTPNYTYNNSQTPGVQVLNLEVTDANGCKEDVDVTVTVNALPIVAIIPPNPSVCVNSDLVLTAQVTGNGQAPYTYVWAESTGKLTPMGQTANFRSAVVGPFQVNVAVTDDNSCSASASQIVIVKPLATLKLNDEYSVCAGTSLLLDVNPTNIPGSSFIMHWVGGASNRIIDSTNVLKSIFRSNDVGDFDLYYTISDINGCPRVDTVTVHVLPAVKLAPITDKNACVGVSLPIAASVLTAGNPANVQYAWIGNVIPTFGNQTNFTAATAGVSNIKLVATEGQGANSCSDSLTFSVTVHDNPRVEITANVQTNNVPYTSQVQLDANIAFFTTPSYTYYWENAGAVSSGQSTSRIFTIPITQTRTYNVTLTDDNGCIGTDTIVLSTENIIIDIWHPCTDVIPVNPDVLVSGICLDKKNEICIGQTIRLVPQFQSGSATGLSYTWTDDAGLVVATTINAVVRPTKQTTIYTLTVANSAGFETKAQYLVIAHPNPTANITVSPEYGGSFYINDALTVNGNPTGGFEPYVKHTWVTNVAMLNPNVQITQVTVPTPQNVSFVYSVEDSKGCKAVTSRAITVIAPVLPNILGNDACEKSNTVYSLDRTYPIGTIYVWTVTGGQIVGSNTNSTVEVYWPNARVGEVSVYVKPQYEKEAIRDKQVVIGKIPDVSISGPVHVCQGDIVNYNAINKGTNTNLGYSWAIATDVSSPLFEPYYSEWWDGTDHELLQAVNAPASDVATVQWKNEGKDKVILTARDAGCKVTVDLDVTIHPLPKPDFRYKSVEKVYFQKENVYRFTDSIYKDKQVDFTNLTFGNPETAVIDPNVSFYWDFVGDGVFTENAYNTSYEYDESGKFTVQLMAVDQVWGCKDTIAKPLIVIANPNCGLKFPNAFTPDLTANNTFFPVYNEGVLETGYELRIYNRWGTLLWVTNDKQAQWDGYYKGEISRQDVYVYHCKAVCEEKDPVTGKERELNIKGDVTVIR